MSDTSVPPPDAPGSTGTTGTTGSTGTTGLAEIVAWYDGAARDLPWRSHHSREQASPWGVLVSEVMLQQTPVSRVLPVYQEWMRRWPSPSALAQDSPGEAVRVWGRLGYPRRALRLHSAARVCVDKHDGQVPDSLDELRALPGVGEYTASAIAAFAFGQRCAVLDTNVRRVQARWLDGVERPKSTSVTNPERLRAIALLPPQRHRAARASIAMMELGALVCTARSPKCEQCPLQGSCAWQLDGRPPSDVTRRAQAWAGTDRQCRGRLMAIVREAHDAITHVDLEQAWDDSSQRERALTSLIDDGLLVADGGKYRLP